MMPYVRSIRYPWRLLAAGVTVAAALAASLAVSASAGRATQEAKPPPPGAAFDYQLGGAYQPPDGVRVVSRDREAPPAPGAYTICYVNGFQAQPGEEHLWDEDLLLTSEDDAPLVDKEWDDEAILDISQAGKRERIADVLTEWIDGCAADGFDAVEIDNLDTFTRFPGHLDREDAIAHIRTLADHAHAQGLAMGQKNTAELLGERDRTGLDFAIVEQCGEHRECRRFVETYGDHVIVIEYDRVGLDRACERYGDRLSIVLRDRLVRPPGEPGHARETCPATS